MRPDQGVIQALHCIAFLFHILSLDGVSHRIKTTSVSHLQMHTSGNDLGTARSSATSAELDSTASSSVAVKVVKLGTPKNAPTGPVVQLHAKRILFCKIAPVLFAARPPISIHAWAISRWPGVDKWHVATMAFPPAKWPYSRTPSTESGIKHVDPLNPSLTPNGNL